MKIKKGTILALTKGKYSDYCLMGHVRALADFVDHETKTRFVEQFPKPEWWECFDLPAMYMAWLIREGLVDPCDEVLEYYVEFPYDMIKEWLDGV